MKNGIFGKALAFVIIILFVGTSVIPIIGSNAKQGLTNRCDESTSISSFATDWWSMFHHDLSHSGYSTSIAPVTNKTLWTYATGDFISSSPAVTDGKVYIGSGDHKLYCFDAMTGIKLWEHITGDYVSSSPAVADGKVYVGSRDNKVYCLNANTGEKIWEYLTEGEVRSSPAFVNGKVYIGSYGKIAEVDGKVYCLNAATGAMIWNYTTGDIHLMSSPAVVDGKVYIGSGDGNVYCLDAETGVKVWSYQLGDWVCSSPAVVDGKVYIGPFCTIQERMSYGIYCLNAATGAELWYRQISIKFGTVSSPAVANNRVYFGFRDNKVYCLDANTGAEIWNYNTGSEVGSSPCIADGKIYIGSYFNKKLYCLNAETGEKIWDYTTGDVMFSSPAIADGKVYVGSEDGKVYCFGGYYNQTPTPPIITGPTHGKIGISYNYTFNSTCIDGEPLGYMIDWGDGSHSLVTGLSGTETIAKHTWTTKGTYGISARTKTPWGEISQAGTLKVTMPRTISFNQLFMKFLEQFPHAFQILRHLLKL